MDSKTFHMIVNPTIKRNELDKEIHSITTHFLKYGIEIQIHKTEHERHAIEIAEGLVRSGSNDLISYGGDGTAFEVINGIMRSGKHQQARLGILPCGTGNAFLKDFGMFTWRDTADRIIQNRTQKVDIGRITPEGMENKRSVYFHNIVAFGTFAEACRLRHTRFKLMGRHGYNAAFLYFMTHLKMYPFELKIDGSPSFNFSGPIAAVCNSQYTGHKARLSPFSKIDDGQFEVIYVEDIQAMELFKLFLKHNTGEHLNHSSVTSLRASRIEISIKEIDQTMVDGELFKNIPLKIENLHLALEIFA